MAKTDLGDGPPCPEEGDHGRLVTGVTGRLWCPVSQSIFAPSKYDEDTRTFVPGPLMRAGYFPPRKKEVLNGND